jgi:hypothetical protein
MRGNTAHARIRALGEQAMATLKTWRLLPKLRCSTTESPVTSKPSSPSTSPAQTEVGKGSLTPKAYKAER